MLTNVSNVNFMLENVISCEVFCINLLKIGKLHLVQLFTTLLLEFPCNIYVNVTDPSQFWESRSRSIDTIQSSCQNHEFPFWTRFLYSNSKNAILSQNCTSAVLNKGNPPCGALYRGQIQGEHPSTEDGSYLCIP